MDISIHEHIASSEQSTLRSPTELVEGYSRDGLALTTLLDSTWRSFDADKPPDIDVIHVMAVGGDENRLSLETLLEESITTERREFVFRVDIAKLLVGDFAFQAVEEVALQLLGGLNFFQQHDKEQSRRAIVFVAYDLGAVIVKKAICIAGANEEKWPGIFTNTARIGCGPFGGVDTNESKVFSGCFHRTDNIQLLYSKLSNYLSSQRNDSSIYSLTPLSISGLADCLVEATEAFIASKIALRSRVISLYANTDTEGQIQNVFDCSTATIGLPNEITIQEQRQQRKGPFPDLAAEMCFNIWNWIPHTLWVPMERTLMALAPAHRQLSSSGLVDSHSVLKSPQHKAWKESSGLRILYLCGQDHRTVTVAAEQILFRWKLEQRRFGQRISTLLPFCFVFSSHDPMLCSMKGMLGSLLLSSFAGHVTGTPNEEYDLLKDQFLLQRTWTENDLLKLFFILTSARQNMLLLQDIDECDKGSREALWTMLSTFAASSEAQLKIVATCRGSLDLSDELQQWPDIVVDRYIIASKKAGFVKVPNEEFFKNWISILSPCGYGEAEIQQGLGNLKSMEAGNLNQILRLIMDLTNWPQEPSTKALDEFSSHLRAVTLSSTPADILDRALRNIADQEGLGWALNWLIHGQRPLSYDELATVLCYCKRGKNQPFDTPSPSDVRVSLSQLRKWLRGITESWSGQVRIRNEVWSYLQNDSNYIWAETVSPRAIPEFLFDYLTSPEIQKRLESMYSLYESRVQQSGDDITPPLVPDGRDIIFYAIHALPYHLSENPIFLQTIGAAIIGSDRKLSSWSKAYWAMSNPFSRPKFEALKSPCETLLELGNMGEEAAEILKEMQHQADTDATHDGEIEGSDKPMQMKCLGNLIRDGCEDKALSLAQSLISASNGQGPADENNDTTKSSSKIPWPSSFLWRATWLNMDRLVTLLLKNGMSPDPTDGASIFFPSPLNMAARLCHPLVMEALIEHGARIDVKRFDKYSSMYTSAGSGNLDGVETLLAKDALLLELQEPEPPLYSASNEGYWRIAKRLLELGADPNSGIGPRPNYRWAPLVVAARYGYLETARILLQNNADPNICGPNNCDTPLWFAAVCGPSLDLVRLLLEYGADPNHELLKPPLLGELVASRMPAKDKLARFEVLVANSPPIIINATDSRGSTPLLRAALAGELSIVSWLLENGADIDAVDNQGCGAIIHAINGMHVDVVRELLKWKPKLDILTPDGETLLQIAMEDISLFQMLLDAGADPELRNRDNVPAINVAVVKKKTKVVELLVDRKVKLDCRDKSNWTPILDATGYKPDAEITRILAKGGANLGDTTALGSTPLHLAVMEGEADIVRVLLEFRKRVDLEKRNNDGETPLLVADADTSMECLELLIQAGADVNAQDAKGWTCLGNYADSHLPLQAADLLLSQPEIEIDMMGDLQGTALMLACRSLNHDMVVKLLAHKADPNISCLRPRSTALIAACMPLGGSRNDDVDKIDGIITELVAHGADVNATEGCTIYNAICAASLAAGVSTINLLLDQGASALRPDPVGRLPIHFAAANGIQNFEAVASIYRGDLMACDSAGKNVLHWAAQFGHVETIKAILSRVGRSKKQYINQADIDGWTPLCWAMRPFEKGFCHGMASEPRAYAKTVRYLLDQGADDSVTFRMGTGEQVKNFTPFQMASLCGAEDEIIRMLDGSNDARSEQQGMQHKDSEGRKRYKAAGAYCDVCLTDVFGCSHRCQSCVSFDACKKCYGRIDLYHGHLRTKDGKPHAFAFREGFEEEFEDVPAPGSPKPRSDGDSRRSSTSLAGGQGEELDLEEIAEEVGELDPGELEELEELEPFDEDVASP